MEAPSLWGKEEILDEIQRLSQTFTPEWNFDRDNPDAGSVIALIFAEQTADTIIRCQMVLDKYHTEFVNLFGITPRPVTPARAVIVLGVSEDAVQGLEIKKGIRFLAQQEQGEQSIVFSSCFDLYATHAKLISLWMVSGVRQGYLSVKNFPFRLFGQEGLHSWENALLFYHSFAMDCQTDIFCLRLSGSYSPSEFAEKIVNSGDYRLSYYSFGGFRAMERVWQEDDYLCMQRGKQEQKQQIQREYSLGHPNMGIRPLEKVWYSVLRLERVTPLYEDIRVERVEIFPRGSIRKPDFILNDDRELDCEQAVIFGEELAVYQNCYLGQEEVFQKQGAQITCSFVLSYGEYAVSDKLPEKKQKLPLIKRRERSLYQPATAEVWAQEIVVSYYNGMGWRRLDCGQQTTAIFVQEKGEYEISFLCPEDWSPAAVGSYEQRCLRIQLVKAEGCYMRPAKHHYPVLSRLRLRYEYQKGRTLQPQIIQRQQGMTVTDLTSEYYRTGTIQGFLAVPMEGESLLLGLDKKPSKGPVSFYFVLEDHVGSSGIDVVFAYSSREGFQELKVEDRTEGFARTGMVLWMPPEDMARQKQMGEERYWIRIKARQIAEENSCLPMIQRIYLNAVEVWNVERQEQQEFYLDRVEANMCVPLSGANILSAQVWVNEKDQLSEHQIEDLLQNAPQDTEAEYDLYGMLRAFYVKWREVETFDHSFPLDRHYQIDRMRNQLIFGDGVHVRIPRMLQDTAFRVLLSTCGGQEGNVPAGAIHIPYNSQLFLEQVENPLPASGGSNQEEPEAMQRRAGALFGNRGRLVTTQDFVREALYFSDAVAKGACVVGETITGETNPRSISIVILMKEYQQGSTAFYQIMEPLKKHFLTKAEMNCQFEEIEIVEPVFVKMAVELWLQPGRVGHVLEMQEDICNQICAFLDPITGQYGTGWEIGRLPRKKQIQMMLNGLHTDAIMLHYAVTLSYTDHQGKHQADLAQISEMPFAICCNGEHEIHIVNGHERSSYAHK